MAAGALEEVLGETEASPGRPLVVCPATRPDVILGLGAAQVQPFHTPPTCCFSDERPPFHICSLPAEGSGGNCGAAAAHGCCRERAHRLALITQHGACDASISAPMLRPALAD